MRHPEATPETAQPVARTRSGGREPSLLWSAVDYSGSPIHLSGRPSVPTRGELFDRRRACQEGIESGKSLVLRPFLAAVSAAVDCIYILDPHFSEADIAALERAVKWTHATSLWIVGRSRNAFPASALQESLQDWRNEGVPTVRPPGTVKCSGGLDQQNFPFPHDRFAVIDQELWHFGATVGGGHPSLTAQSRGWDAEVAGFKIFFERVFSGL